MFKRFCLILSVAICIVLFAVLPGLAQSIDTAWVRRYNGPGNDWDDPSSIAVDGYGNVYVTGASWASGTGMDYATIKYDTAGTELWVKRYNGPGNSYDGTDAIAVDDSGYVYVTGESEGSGTGGDYATIKYYPNGDTAWVRRYDGPESGNDGPGLRGLAIDTHGNVYVTGGSGHVPEEVSEDDYATIKYYPNGDTAWVRSYNGPADGVDGGIAITVDDSGNVYVTGVSEGIGTDEDYTTMKYDSSGKELWVKRYNGPGDSNDYAVAIVVDSSGNVYVTGYSYASGTDYDYATIKYYPNGDTAWVRRYNGPANGWDWGVAIAVDDSGNIYVTGRSPGSGTHEDYATIRYYPNGDTAWVRRYNGPGNGDDGGIAIAIDGSGNAYVTGESYVSEADDDYATMKYDSSGKQDWVKNYDGLGSSYDYARAIAVDDSGYVYVTGCSYGSGTGKDYATIKYVQTGTDVKDETENREKPSEYTLSQNYPNPFNQNTKIEFTLAKSGFVSLSIYDILGRRIRTLVSEHVSLGYKSVLWGGKNDLGKDVASGIYFYRLRVGDFSDTKKLVLLK